MTTIASSGIERKPHDSWFVRYFTFRSMITTSIINIVYLLGAIILTAYGIYLIFPALGGSGGGGAALPAAGGAIAASPAASGGGIGVSIPLPHVDPDHAVVVGIMVLLVGNLAWRVGCEVLIVMFALYRAAESIDEQMMDARVGEAMKR